MKRSNQVLSFLLTLVLLASSFVLPASAEGDHTVQQLDGIVISLEVRGTATFDEACELTAPISAAETYEHCVYAVYDYDETNEEYICVDAEGGTCTNFPTNKTLVELRQAQCDGSEIVVIDGSATVAKMPTNVNYHLADEANEIEPFTLDSALTVFEFMEMGRKVNVETQIAYEASTQTASPLPYQRVVGVVMAKEGDTYTVFDMTDCKTVTATLAEIDGMFADGEGEFLILVPEKIVTEEPPVEKEPEEKAGFPVWAAVVIAVAVLAGAYVGCYFLLYKKGKLTAKAFEKAFLPMEKLMAKLKK